MYTPEQINKIHAELQKTFSRGLVLLGGSYLYGDAAENSDLDFYFIGGLRDCNYYRQHKKLLEPIKNKLPKINLMLAPNLFLRFGWYYIYGKDTAKNLVVGHIDKKINIRNFVKLAYFTYLGFVCGRDSRANLIKSAQRLCAALVLNKIEPKQDPLFSKKYLISRLDIPNIADRGLLTKILNGDFTNDDIGDLGRRYAAILENARAGLSDYFNFSLINYLVYNCKFLKRGIFRFLFINPDKYVLDKISAGIKSAKDLKVLYEEIKDIVFPVIIL